MDSLPNRVVSCLEVGKRLHAKVNLDAKDASEMIFEDWELA